MSRTLTVIVALALTGCGSDRYAAEREQVEKLMPEAEDVECTGEPRKAVDCEGTLDGRPMYCQFRFQENGREYSGTSGCWSDRRQR